ncbi:MAG TPA: alpha/beta fold hydrolase [Rhizomicrobium sp.]|jgi:pimeloyl-ACP methyl ester carboxylesterase|nr:alpha/beta fold hydrolase [Rhizomicrobium sp.]
MTTFIFLHGSFHAAWNWHRVLPYLERAGHRGLASDLPGHGRNAMKPGKVTLKRCVDHVLSVMDEVPAREDIVLVAHSRNGIVISQTAEARPERLKGLVYLAAYLVPNRRSMMEYALEDPQSLVVRNIEAALPPKTIRTLTRLFRSGLARAIGAALLPSAMQMHRLKRAAYREALYHDCGPEIVELANTLLEAEPNWAGFEPLRITDARFGRVPKAYIECLQDRAVTLPLQRRMLRDTPCDRVFSMDASHSPFFSQPERLADLLLQAVEGFGQEDHSVAATRNLALAAS